MTVRPAVSVIMPAYHAAQTIEYQLAALSQQRGAPAWELIVADNGSADSTAARVQTWARRLENLRLVDASARPGAAAARNIGAAQARGRMLLFCDADDAAEQYWIAQLAGALEFDDAAAGSRAYDALNAKRFGPADWPAPIFTKAPLRQLAAASSHNLGIRAEAFEAVGGFDERLSTAEDVDLCWRLQLAGFSFAAAPGAMMQIRRRSGIAAVFRQAYAYGRGDRVLARRFADLDPGHHPGRTPMTTGQQEPVSAQDPGTEASSAGETDQRAGEIDASAGRSSLLPDWEFHAHRLGHFLGHSLGRDPVPALEQQELR